MIGSNTKVKTVRTKPRKSDWDERLEDKRREQELHQKRRLKREPLDSRYRDDEGS